MISRINPRRVFVSLTLLLAGCASLTPPQNPGESPQAQQTALPRPFQEAIDLTGRLSMHYQGAFKEEALHGNFTWAQQPAQTTVTMLSPLGQTLAVIDLTPAGATLTQAGQQPRAAADVDTLTAETLGWPLPVSGLRDWLQGFATDTHGRRFVATPESADVVTRDGWHLHYADWQDAASPAAPQRPRRIDLERSTKQAGEVAIRIVIDTWQPR
jgi:outer membrane lipoprotein LolB